MEAYSYLCILICPLGLHCPNSNNSTYCLEKKSTNILTKSACLYVFTSTAFTEWINCLETKDCGLAYGLQYICSVNKQTVMTVIHHDVRTY